MLKSQFSPFSAAPPLRLPPPLAHRLTGSDAQGARYELGRLAAGFGFAALYGLALGTRAGGPALRRHALGAASGLAAVALLAVPSLFVLLALVDAPLSPRVSPRALLATSARALATTGLILVLGFALGLTALVTLLLAWPISRPLERLAHAARRIAAWDGGVLVPVTGGGEIGAAQPAR
jgi:hypothetical protein